MRLSQTRLPQILLIGSVLALPLAAAGPVVVLIGPPASGKSTQAEILQKTRGMTVVSADVLIANNKDRFTRYKYPTLTGVEPHLDPALNGLVEQALRNSNLDKGVVLDGYPAARIHGDYLVALREKLKLPAALVVHLRIPDDEVRRRMSQQKSANIDQQLKDYHREFDFAKTYFPQADLREVDGTQSIEAIAAEIRKLIETR